MALLNRQFTGARIELAVPTYHSETAESSSGKKSSFVK